MLGKNQYFVYLCRWNIIIVDMKRAFGICAVMLAVAIMATSCFGSRDEKVVSTALASIVTGDSSLGEYVIFDNGQAGLITKGNELVNQIPADAYFPDQATGEARAWIYYTSEAVNDLIFDGKVEIEALYPVDIQLADTRLPANIADEYKDEISVSSNNITYTRDRYVNLQLFYKSVDSFFDDEHKFRLVYNSDKTGYFAESYPANDDGYLYLELYHDAGSDVNGQKYKELIMSFYLDDLMIGRHISSEYKGIKIFYREGGKARVVEYKF